ncbi:MAG: methyl-accepting chemotaxis protein, partial [Burkholderiales bacterium]
VQAAGTGDFTRQITMENKEGFYANLGKGLNELVSTIEVALNDIRRMLGAMARGDLSERITRDYSGTFGQLKDDANTTADKLTEIISKIRSSSGAILSAANEIAQGNADLSQRTEEQASSLEETASSMEQMTSTVKQSAENAQRANGVSQMAQRKAKEGGQVVGRAVQAMEEISSSSKKISDIIGVIDEIAFQTNLLALNAAVEAARAGEQGRGFAVVAGEVRNLAQRSAGAAKEIKELIRDSGGKVQDGRQLVHASGETLSEIVAAVEQVSIMMQEIAAAAQEQTSGIEQVNTAVAQMDEMTQQNAALVEQASAAGASLADQANAMNSVVDFFSVGGRFESSYQPPPARSTRPLNTGGKSSRKNVKKPSSPRTASGSDEQWEEF